MRPDLHIPQSRNGPYYHGGNDGDGDVRDDHSELSRNLAGR
jgi:hypothetical protein